MANALNVSAAKPKVGGAIYRAPLGTTLPTDATTALDAAFKNLGYAGEDGLTNNNSPETDKKKAWGGDTVLVTQSAKPDTLKFVLIEATNIEVLKAIYGDDNVTGDLATGITVKANATLQKECAWVFETVLRDGNLKRIVVPQAAVSEVGEIAYKDDDPIMYETTIEAMPDASGNTHYEYIVEPA